MVRVCRGLIVGMMALALLGTGGIVRGDNDRHAPHDSLVRLMENGRHANYDGVQTLETQLGKKRQGKVRISQWDGILRTEILSPDRLKGLTILERGPQQLARRPGSNNWIPRPANPPQSLHRMLRNYTLQRTGNATIAGRTAAVVEIRPRNDASRLARKLWVDTQSGVVLRTEIHNWTGQLAYVTAFEQIDFSPNLDSKDFKQPWAAGGNCPGHDGHQPPPPPDNSQDATLPMPHYLPSGYQLAGRPHFFHMELGTAAHVRYSDGLNTISVFIRRLNPGEMIRRHRPPMPAMDHLYSSVIHYVKGDYRVTLIGDVAPAELQRMAESVE